VAFIPHNRLTLLGDRIVSSEVVETWSMTLNFGGDLSNQAASPDHNEDIEDALRTRGWLNSSGVGVSDYCCNNTRLVGFKWNPINSAGKYTNPAEPNTWLFETPIPGTGGATPKLTPQASIVASLYTDLVGRRYRGRIYWPADGITLTNDWKVPDTSPAIQDNYLNSTVAMIDTLNTLMSGFSPASAGVCIIASSYGVNTPVTSVKVGNVVDTQRRRRAQLVEEYMTGVIA